MYKLLLLYFILALSACRPIQVEPSPGYILETNDILSTAESKAIIAEFPASRSIVILATQIEGKRQKFCTGNIIEYAGTPHILTNHHCFAKNSTPEVSDEVHPDACASTKVYLDSHGDDSSRNAESFSCKVGSLRTQPVGDIAIFELATPLPKTVKTLTFASNTSKLTNHAAMIFHYPDVKENYANIADAGVKLPQMVVTQAHCEIEGVFPRHQWSLDKNLQYGLKHSCDIINGSSGSVLLDPQTEEVLGLNWGGINIHRSGESIKINVATHAEAVKEFLKGHYNSEDLLSNPSQAKIKSASLPTQKISKKQNINKKQQAVQCGSIAHAPPSSKLIILWILLTPIFMTLIYLHKKK